MLYNRRVEPADVSACATAYHDTSIMLSSRTNLHVILTWKTMNNLSRSSTCEDRALSDIAAGDAHDRTQPGIIADR